MNKDDKLLLKKAAIVTMAVVIVTGVSWLLYSFLGFLLSIWGNIINFLLPFIFAFVFAYILKPVVNFLETKKIPRLGAILLIYIAIGTLLFFVGTWLFSTMIYEAQKLIALAPQYASDLQDIIKNLHNWAEHWELPIAITDAIIDSIEEIEYQLTQFLDRILDIDSVLGLLMSIFGHFLSLVAFPVILLYFLKDAEFLKEQVSLLIPNKYRKRTLLVFSDIDRTIGAYIRSQIIICGFIGVLTYLGLLILGVDFALILGVVAGITNIIPYFGPFIGAVPSTIVAFLQSPTLAIKVVILITVIQQIESQIVAPQVFGKNLAFHPLVVIAALIAGGNFFGVIGMILAVPVVAILRVFLRHLALGYWLDS